METQQADISPYYGFLAHHCEQAGKIRKAIDFGLFAGKKALRVNANNEAVVFFRKALSLIEEYPDGGASHVLEECHVDLAEGKEIEISDLPFRMRPTRWTFVCKAFCFGS